MSTNTSSKCCWAAPELRHVEKDALVELQGRSYLEKDALAKTALHKDKRSGLVGDYSIQYEKRPRQDGCDIDCSVTPSGGFIESRK